MSGLEKEKEANSQHRAAMSHTKAGTGARSGNGSDMSHALSSASVNVKISNQCAAVSCNSDV